MNTTRQGDITGFDDAEVVDEEQEEDSSQTETRERDMRKDRAILIENEEERKIYYPRFYGVVEDFSCMTEEEMQKCKKVVEKYTPKQ